MRLARFSALSMPPAEEAGRLQVVLEEVGGGLPIVGIELDGLLKILASFPGVSRGRKNAAGFGAASVHITQQPVQFGTSRR